MRNVVRAHVREMGLAERSALQARVDALEAQVAALQVRRACVRMRAIGACACVCVSAEQ